MSGRETGWILFAVAVVVSALLFLQMGGKGVQFRKERDAFRDSLAVARANEAILSAQVDSLTKEASKHTAKADTLKEAAKVTVILPGVLKITEHATVDQVQTVIMKEPK